MPHVPVMMEEVIKFLDPKPNEHFVDCTLGDGGHATAILEKTGPNGKVLGLDADPEAVAWNQRHGGASMEHGTWNKRLIIVNENFRNLATVVKEKQFGPIKGILLDLGFSSSTLERGRGFTFQKDEPLDMRFNPQAGIRAAEIVNGWNQKQLTELFEEYGEEKLAREIANKIVEERKKKSIVTSGQLAEVVTAAYREKLKSKKEMPWVGGMHPATKTFQSLRIEVNDELGALQDVLPQALGVLAPGGRLAVIAFHSLEDRIVKAFFRDWPEGGMKILTKKPVVPSDDEIKNNSRARSAKLRVIEKV